jgi:hypothetical protein
MRPIDHFPQDAKRCAQVGEQSELVGLRPAREFLVWRFAPRVLPYRI